MTTIASPIIACRRCRAAVPLESLVCPNCGLFTHVDDLQSLSAKALQLEHENPVAAASLWRQTLELLPQDSPQYQAIYHRAGALSAGMLPAAPFAATGNLAPLDNAAGTTQSDTFRIAILKTIGSMLLSIAVYAFLWRNLEIAVAFCAIILIHELGHVIANKYYGLSAGPPIFLPFVGAVINLKQRPPNARVEAVIGIAGPVLGTIGAIGCYLVFLQTGIPVFGACAYFGFILNLFNLLPVPPLDGGRVTAAVSPWIWTLGLAGLAWMVLQGQIAVWMAALIGFYAFPRVAATLRGRERFSDYYRISRMASWTIAILYVALGALLMFLFQHARGILSNIG